MRDGLLEKIYNATNSGLDIILYYYPQAQDCVNNKKHFKIRANEKTPSASIKLIKNIWRVTDWGDDSNSMSPIDIVIREENCNFNEALLKCADRYNVSDTLKPAINKPDFKSRAATDDEPDGHLDFELNDNITDAEIPIFGQNVKIANLNQYGWHSVKWYSTTKERKTFIFFANENYPIFARTCKYFDKNETTEKSFTKIIKPNEPEKRYRFMYIGAKPKDYINGLFELKKLYSKLIVEQNDDENEDNSNAQKTPKLPEVILCSGERDAMCVAGHGYIPIWLNSETAQFTKENFDSLSRMCEKIYNLPDIDSTGLSRARELALTHIDILTIQLPQSLRQYKDNRGRERKDFRDFVDIYKKADDFRKLIKVAQCCRFWDRKKNKNGTYRLEINAMNLTYFLKTNGFSKIIDSKTKKTLYLQVIEHILYEKNEDEIMDFLINFLTDNYIDLDVQNLVATSANCAPAIKRVKQQLTKLSLSSATADEQFLFFKNKAVKVVSNDVYEIHKSEISNFVWDNDICKHDFKRIDSALEITYQDYDNINLNLENIQSHFLRFVINSSRTYWREELENRLDDSLQENEDYATKFKFSLTGDRLTPEERKEQIQNFCNKVYTIGYLIHSYKSRSKSMGVWIMENKLIEDGESSGGSGKSFFIDFIKTIKNTVNLSGRNKKLTDNQHVIENVDERTDIINIDDAWQYFDFDFFYSAITGNLTVNGKHTKSKEIDYDDVPKIVITSNFPPPRNDSSTMRRLLLVSMSDYYHKATSENDYQEDRRISDDFGYDLYDSEYKQEFWNQDYNFLIDCLQFYLKLSKQNIIIQPPMDKITARINAAKMGPQFAEWAAVYFSEESENLDCLIPKKRIYDQFIRESGVKWTTQKFGKAIKAFVANAEFIEMMNPPELRCNDGRIIRKLDGEACEMYYLKHILTTEIHDRMKGEF